MGKRIFQSVMSVFLIFQSIKLIEIITLHRVENGLAIVAFALALNLFLTGIFAFAVFAWPVEKLLPELYYRVRNPKRLKSLSKFIGLDNFKALLLATVWRSKKMQKELFDGTQSGLNPLNKASKKSEFGHFLPFVLLLGICIYLCIDGQWWLAFVTTIINVIFNFYPVILQRHHRMRIDRISLLLARRKS